MICGLKNLYIFIGKLICKNIIIINYKKTKNESYLFN